MKKLLHFFLILITLHISDTVAAHVHIEELLTEYTPIPFGIDVQEPGIGRQMIAADGKKGLSETFNQVYIFPVLTIQLRIINFRHSQVF